MHTALAYFQAGRTDAGFKLLKSSILDGMYLGESPANFGSLWYSAGCNERTFVSETRFAVRMAVCLSAYTGY